MADIYVDLALSTGTNAGTSWTNAYQGCAGLATAAAAASAGDDIWIKGQGTYSGSNLSIQFSSGTLASPIKLMACKSATTNEPPQQSDLIPGIWTGQSTRAQDDGDVPSVAGATSDNHPIKIDGQYVIYGIEFLASTDFQINTGSGDAAGHFVECRVGWGTQTGSSKGLNFGGNNYCAFTRLTQCEIAPDHSSCRMSSGRGAHTEFDDCTQSLAMTYCWDSGLDGTVLYRACDLSNINTTFVDVTNVANFRLTLENCETHASLALTSGSAPNAVYRIASYQSEPDGTAKGTGESRQSMEVATDAGDIVVTTADYRDSGADDGADGNYAWAMTPSAALVPNFRGFRSDLIVGWVMGDGTSKTAKIRIANDSGADLYDDDISARLFYPSEAGGAKHELFDTKMNLLGTPSQDGTYLKDDTVSTWNGSAANPQVIEIPIAPDYEGPIYAEVELKLGATDTVFIDPMLEVA